MRLALEPCGHSLCSQHYIDTGLRSCVAHDPYPEECRTMKDKDKNRDPEKARARAVADCRCALRKLGLLDRLETWAVVRAKRGTVEPRAFLWDLAEALGIKGGT